MNAEPIRARRYFDLIQRVAVVVACVAPFAFAMEMANDRTAVALFGLLLNLGLATLLWFGTEVTRLIYERRNR